MQNKYLKEFEAAIDDTGTAFTCKRCGETLHFTGKAEIETIEGTMDAHFVERHQVTIAAAEAQTVANRGPLRLLIEDLVDRRLPGLRTVGPNDFLANCPAHDDAQASLHITFRNEQPLLLCAAGCTRAAIIEALALRGCVLTVDQLSHNPARWHQVDATMRTGTAQVTGEIAGSNFVASMIAASSAMGGRLILNDSYLMEKALWLYGPGAGNFVDKLLIEVASDAVLRVTPGRLTRYGLGDLTEDIWLIVLDAREEPIRESAMPVLNCLICCEPVAVERKRQGKHEAVRQVDPRATVVILANEAPPVGDGHTSGLTRRLLTIEFTEGPVLDGEARDASSTVYTANANCGGAE